MHARQRRLQIVGNIVGDVPDAFVQFLNAREHAVEVFRQAVELIAGPAYRKPSGQIAAHDALRSDRNFINTLQGAPPDEEPDQECTDAHDAERGHERAAHDEPDLLRLAKIAAHHDPDAIGHDDHPRDGGVHLRIVAFIVAFIGDGSLDPALSLQNTDFDALDIAGNDAPCGIGYEIKIGSRLTPAPVDRAHEAHNAATFDRA